ncbi:FAD-dependent oxidoreductase [Patescibacteria group bacterium]|nr:FAD-dependent oxidoreductase [Patescibacteria group bacterium]
MLDLVIVGGSAAGLSASIYAARRNLNFKIISDNLGGEVAMSGVVGNWPGIININGVELAQKMIDHVKSFKVDIEQGWKIVKIAQEKNHHVLTAQNSAGEEKTYKAKSVIIATGIHPRKLNIPGEKEFLHKGITYCTVCDGPLFKNKITATVGSGNSALESALMMSKIAKKVYVLSKFPNTPEMNGGFRRAEKVLIEAVKSTPNVEILYSALAQEIVGDKVVNELKYKDENGEIKTIETQGVMVHIGNIPNSDFVDCASKDPLGQIIVNNKCQTDCKGIFAAGDVTDLPYKQIVIASGQGAIAALSAIEYINRWKE